MSKVTIREVAERAGVSIATVSNVLSGRKAVTAQLTKRVNEAARELSYQVDRAASQLRSGRTQVVGVLVPNFNDTFFTALVSRIESLAATEGYQVVVVSGQDNPDVEAARLDALMGWRPSGVIAIPATNAPPALLCREVGSLPIILVDRVGQDDLGFDTVTVDNYAAGWETAEHLLDNGHTSIAIASSVSAFRPIRERIRGVTENCLRHKAPPPQIIEVGIDHERGADILCDWLDANSHPTALVGMTNVTTLAALSALARKGLEIPDAMSLIGFDDYAWMTARKIPLTAVRQPIEVIADRAWEHLMFRIKGGASGVENIVLSASLQVRNSVACLA
ncbi:LacI family DNA-binding transcriptional regulator [Devosia sp.]|uniref:LacI family DNA-binding transcriptional regulator n=1 Tax=Devosia sp. TaxID=1871048 RepID=UPI002AFDEB5A|nr:LacI family DNA-binding transcriptional regulator [Devosia sp.]